MTEPSMDPALHRAIGERLDWLVRPCAVIGLAGPASDPTSSFLAGHPYLPAGADWPVSPQGAYVFLVQVNFAEVPPLPGFPTSGLLQWFTEPGDTYGLTFDASAGAVGFHVRWYAPPYAPSTMPPQAPAPGSDEDYVPIEIEAATSCTFTPALSLPRWESLPEVARQDPIWSALAAASGEDPDDRAFAYDEYARGQSGDFGRNEYGSKIGGYPEFTQWDPHGTGAYAAPGSPASSLLVELDSAQVGGWGDAGIAHLFGDPGRIGWGDLSSVRYHWDCS